MTQGLGILEFLYQNFKKHFIMSGAFILNIIITAFVLSFSHCSFMCGGFNVILGRLCAGLSKLSTLAMMLLYHAGRTTAYACLGAVFGYFGAGVMRDASAKGLVFFGAGVLLVVLGVSLLFRGKMLAFFENSFIQGKILALALKLQKRRYIVLLGFLNGLLPCGVVYAFLAMSFSLGSGALSALVMILAGLCTTPALLFYALLSRFFTQRLRFIFELLSALLVCAYGLYLAFKGYMLL